VLVESVITWLQARDYGKVELLSVGQESVTFGLPEALRQELPD